MTKALLDKLGYKAGTPALAWRVPADVAPLLTDLSLADHPSFRIAFVRNQKQLKEAAEAVALGYAEGGQLWIAYPKESGAIAADLDRDHGWEPIAALGLRAVTQIAVDENWSALRFRQLGEVKRQTRRSEQG